MTEIAEDTEPVSIESLSKVGFGSYRLTDCSDHCEALLYAIKNGCNLIDTASTYTNGQSERLIGRVLSQNPAQKAFVVTKAGYINKINVETLSELNARGLAKDDIVSVNSKFLHSINPHFLESQITASLNRLERDFIDVFLIHNPEYFFQQKKQVSEDEFYKRIKDAFGGLEEQADKGKIRYYGISSNTFPFSTHLPTTLNLHRLVELAHQVSSSHRFKFIQFPFNLFEDDAVNPNQNGESLLVAAKRLGIITLGNRPLNANSPTGPFRIATYQDATINEANSFESLLGELAQMVQKCFAVYEIDCIAQELPEIKLLSANWKKFSTPDAVYSFFQEHIQPLIQKLFQGEVPLNTQQTIDRLQKIVVHQSRITITQKSEQLRKQMLSKEKIPQNDPRSITTIACQAYLEQGLNHVLVGMKRKDYVDDFKSLFKS